MEEQRIEDQGISERSFSYKIGYSQGGRVHALPNKNKNKEEIICKKCPTCKIVRTPRVYHCSVCDCCISVHDHHCPWVGNCIGQRNHKLFVFYNWVTEILSVYTLALNIHFGANANIFFSMKDEYFSTFWIPLILMGLYGVVVAVLLLGLSIYHTSLALTNQTTSEELKEKYELWGGNPYNYGDYSYKNCLYFWHTQDSLVFNSKSIELHQAIEVD